MPSQLHGIGIGYHEDGNKAGAEGLNEVAAEKHKAAAKYLGVLTARPDAMLARVTFCRPDQAGMLLTSSTVGRPSGP